MTSPTERSLKILRNEGWTAQIVERWNPHARVRQDLFGFVDIIAFARDKRPLLVQTTTASNLAARVAKIRSIEAAAEALRSGFDVQVHGWRAPTKTRRTWLVNVLNMTIEEFLQ